MPSAASILPFLGVALLCFQAAAVPVHTVTVTSCEPAPTGTGNPNVPPTISLPVNGGAKELNSTTLSLKHVTLGHGYQNYTCASPSSTPVAVGALATLYDITSLAKSRDGLSMINKLPDTVAYMQIPSPHLEIIETSQALRIPDYPGSLDVIGHHYFLIDATPTFNLNKVDQILFSKKLGDIPAPSTASMGPDGTGSVDWLQLGDKGGSVGLSLVYRVETAGGKAQATCQGQTGNGTVISVPYAAQYWFY